MPITRLGGDKPTINRLGADKPVIIRFVGGTANLTPGTGAHAAIADPLDAVADPPLPEVADDQDGQMT
jgi:hypothetical protein